MYSECVRPPKTGGGTSRRLVFCLRRRRRKLPFVRLGGPERPASVTQDTAGRLGKVKAFTLRKLKSYYDAAATAVKVFVEAGGSIEALQQEIMIESCLAGVPIRAIFIPGSR